MLPPRVLVGCLAEIHDGDSWGVKIGIVDLATPTEAPPARDAVLELRRRAVFQKQVCVGAGEKLHLTICVVQRGAFRDGQWGEGPGAPLQRRVGERGQAVLHGCERGGGSTPPIY